MNKVLIMFITGKQWLLIESQNPTPTYKQSTHFFIHLSSFQLTECADLSRVEEDYLIA